MAQLRCFIFISLTFFVANSFAQGAPAPLVEAITVKTTKLNPELKAFGTLKAEHGITIRSEVPGRITDIYFKSGDSVQKNQKLVQLNSLVLSAQLKVYEAQLKLSRLNYDRISQLSKKNLVPAAELDKATATLDSDQAHVDEAKARLEQTTILAPFAGNLGLNQLSVGDYLQIGDKIVDLEDSDPIFVDFNIPEVYLSQIGIGYKVTVRSDITPQEIHQGSIVAKDIVANQFTRSIQVRARLPNPNLKLLPGTFAGVLIHLPPQTGIIQIPQLAVSYSEDGNFVYRVIDGNAKKTKVELGYVSESSVVVTKGLKAGDTVITIGTDKVLNDAPVQIKILDGAPVQVKEKNATK